MNILAFNTTGVGTQLAISTQGKKSFAQLEFSKHSETFFPFLEQFLNKNNTKLDEMDIFGVVTGPGSFTGIRIGLSVAKMFAFALGKKCVQVNAFKVLAYNNFDFKSGKICAVINAGAGLLYYQLFKAGNVLEELASPRICSFKQFEQTKEKFNGDIKIKYYDNDEKKYQCFFLEEFKTNLTAEALLLAVE